MHGEKGRGGIGRVLIAFDEQMGREIALKELIRSTGTPPGVIEPEEGASRSAALRFLREARVTGQLEHPGIVPVYEIGRKPDGAPYYTMRLVRGETLSDAIGSAKTLRARLRLLPHFRDICNAVAYAHSRGVVHRDIKPDNIMIGQFGETVVLDWGLAKVRGLSDDRADEMAQGISALHEKPVRRTLTGRAFGTPTYMPPEQARGLVAEVDERSDIYALGAVLYEILAGAPPFDGRTATDIIAKVLSERPIPIASLEREAPPDLCAVVEKALSKKKEERYGSAREMAREIENYMAGGRVEVYEYSSWELLVRFVRKNRALSLLIGILLVLIVLGVSAVFSAWRNAVENERIAHLNLALGYQESADRMLQERRYDKAEIFAAAALGHNPWNPRSPYRFPDLSARSSGDIARNTLSARSSLFLARMNQNDALVAVAPYRGSEVRDMAISPDGRVAALAGKDGVITLWGIEDQKEIDRLPGHRDEVTRVVFSPDGNMLVSASWDRSVRLWDVATRTELATLGGHTEEVYSVVFSPDGRTLISGGNDGTVRRWDIAVRRELSVLVLPGAKIRSIALSPDGASVAVGTATGELHMVRDRSVVSFRPHTEAIVALRYRSDGKRLYTAGYDKRALVIDPATGRVLDPFIYWDAFFALSIDRDGSRSAIASRDGTILLRDMTTGRVDQLRGHDLSAYAVAFTPDGDRLVSAGADGTIRLWRSSFTRSSRSFSGHRTYIPAIALSSDGKLLASSSWDRTVRIWDVTAETERRVIPCTEVCNAVTFSPDGAMLAIAGQDRRIRLLAPDGSVTAFLDGHDDGVSSIAFSPDGRTLVSGGWDRTVRIWDVARRRTVHLFSDHAGAVQSVAFSPDGSLVASAGRDKVIIVRKIADGTHAALLAGHHGNILALAFSPDRRHLASVGEDDTVLVHRLSDGTRILALDTRGATARTVAYDPSGRYLLSVGKYALVWRSDTGDELLRLPLLHQGYAALFSADGSSFALSEGTAVRIYPTRFDIWERDPAQLLRDAEERTRYRLVGFQTMIGSVGDDGASAQSE